MRQGKEKPRMLSDWRKRVNALPDAERDRVLLRAALLIERQSKILGEDTPAHVQTFLDEHTARQVAES